MRTPNLSITIFQPAHQQPAPTTTTTMSSLLGFYTAIRNSLASSYEDSDLDLICTELVTLLERSEPEYFSEALTLISMYDKSLLLHPYITECYTKNFE